jgi:hypothetical protein
MILIRSSKGGEIRQKGNLAHGLARKCNPIKEPSQIGCEIMNRCIASRSPVASSYAQIEQPHLQTRNLHNDVNSTLTASSSQKIQI